MFSIHGLITYDAEVARAEEEGVVGRHDLRPTEGELPQSGAEVAHRVYETFRGTIGM